MSVLIKGMEMPKTCGQCKIRQAVNCERWKHVRSVRLDRHRDCPLVPVPLHGRLIDADVLYEVVKKRTRNWAGGWSDIKCALTGNDIKNAPTIIPADPAEEAQR